MLLEKKTGKGKPHLCLKKAIRKKTDLICEEKKFLQNALCSLRPVSTSVVVRRESRCLASGVYVQVIEKNLGLCENNAKLKTFVSWLYFVADRS